MPDVNFENFCKLARERSGLVLSEEKRYLVEGRLQSIAVAEAMGTVDKLLEKLATGVNEALLCRCVDAMATHETSFFRDRAPFDQLLTLVVPRILEQNAKKCSFRIWSAACSTGQEPYSLAMALFPLVATSFAGWKIEILATDLTEEPLIQARSGRYTEAEIKRGLTDAEIRANFHHGSDGTWEVLPQLKQWVKFRTHNLLDSFVGFGPFDLVFCRNVLIYFNRATKTEVLNKMSKVLNPNGMLMLGSAETVIGLCPAFSVLKGGRGIYQLQSTLTKT